MTTECEQGEESVVHDENRNKLERRLVRKYDLLLLPFLSLMYLFSSLDRSSLGER